MASDDGDDWLDGPTFYDRQGRPFRSMARFSRHLASERYKRVHFTQRAGVSVSTVWLGIDYGMGDGRPQIFETMVFGGPCDEMQWRWSSLEHARHGHWLACLAALPLPPVWVAGRGSRVCPRCGRYVADPRRRYRPRSTLRCEPCGVRWRAGISGPAG